MVDEWVPMVNRKRRPNGLSEAISRGFDRAISLDIETSNRLGDTLINRPRKKGPAIVESLGNKRGPHSAIEVEWLETRVALHLEGAAIDEIDHRPVKTVTRGFLLRETKRAIVVASSVADGKAFGAIFTIPKQAIRRRVEG